MSTHGRGALGAIGLGSVADYVVRHLETPLLLIPAKAGPLRTVPGRRVLVPLDLSSESVRILDSIADLVGSPESTRLTALHVLEPVPIMALPSMPYPVSTDSGLTQLQWDQARSRLEEFARMGRRRGFLVKTRLVGGARAGATILEHLHQGRFDLVAMTTHGYGGFKRLLLGSVTNKVLRHSRKPMLVVRPVRSRRKPARPARAA